MRSGRVLFAFFPLAGRLMILTVLGIAWLFIGLAMLVKYLAIALAWLAYWLGRLLIMPYAAFMRGRVAKSVDRNIRSAVRDDASAIVEHWKSKGGT